MYVNVHCTVKGLHTTSRRTVIQGLFKFPLRNWLKEYQIGATLIIQQAKLQNILQ